MLGRGGESTEAGWGRGGSQLSTLRVQRVEKEDAHPHTSAPVRAIHVLLVMMARDPAARLSLTTVHLELDDRAKTPGR